MSDILDATGGLIVNPKSGEVETARDVMQALCKVLREHGYVLQHLPHTIMLGKIIPGSTTQDGSPVAKAIAAIHKLTPELMQYREFDWSDAVPKVKQ